MAEQIGIAPGRRVLDLGCGWGPLLDFVRSRGAAAQRALRRAERAHDRAIELAERQVRAAKTAKPIAAYGHHVVLYADQLSTADGNHELTQDVTARTETRPEAGPSSATR